MSRYVLAAVWIATYVHVRYLGVAAIPCYFGQEPDPNQGGRLRWAVVQPATAGGGRCLCTSLRAGAVNVVTPARPREPFYSDRPLFTDDLGAILDFFDLEGSAICIRLVGENGQPHPNEGRVEVYYNGEWGTVCDDWWDLPDGHVACRQLGYQSAERVWQSAHHGEGRDHIHLDDLRCAGNETNLGACHHSGWGSHDCYHFEDASVRCNIHR